MLDMKPVAGKLVHSTDTAAGRHAVEHMDRDTGMSASMGHAAADVKGLTWLEG